MAPREMVELLLQRGHTQASLSLATGLRQSTLSKLLTGRQAEVYYTQGQRLRELVDALENEKPAGQGGSDVAQPA